MPSPMRANPNEPIRILAVAGARPNFMKIAPLMHEFAKRPKRFEPILVPPTDCDMYTLSCQGFCGPEAQPR